MNRSSREAMIGGGRNVPIASQHRRGLSLNGVGVGFGVLSKDADDNNNNLDLFSKNRRNHSSDESQVSIKLGRLSLGSAPKPAKSGLDDLLSSSDSGKHDYDWLLTPPETPLFPASDGNEYQPAAPARRSSSSIRSVSTTKSSRLSVSQSEGNHAGRPTRSSSVTRPSVSSSQYSSYSNKSASILNTSSASVSSYIRPSTPTSRSSSTARPSTPSSRPTLTRPSTPSRARPAPSSSLTDRTRPSQTSRPSTPSSRPQISANLTFPGGRSTSRPSTPTRRNSAPSLSPASGPSPSIGRAPSNGRNSSSVSRPSSPGPRNRPAPHPIVLPDFSLETPPNLRTTLPDRPLSAGRSRPGAAATVKGKEDTPSAANPSRRQPSPIVTRGRLTEPSARGRIASGQLSHVSESHRPSHASELSTRKPLKTSNESTGFGRTISKKSLDMAIRHMDIRNGTNGGRSVSGSTLFPQSIRSSSVKSHPSDASNAPGYVNGHLPICSNGGITENDSGNYVKRFYNDGIEEDRPRISAKLTNVDIYESSRYDTILLKEDLKNTSWLHSLDDKTDQESIFDNGFEPLPEPFDPFIVP